MVEFDSIKIKDQLGRPEDKGFTVKRPTENDIIEEGSLIAEKHTRLHSWVVGSSTNGIVGTNTNTTDGEQQIVGAEPVGVLQRVINPNNTFNERFGFNTFEDTGTTTADWNVGSSGKLEMTTGEVAQSTTIAKDGQTWTKATVNIMFETGDSSDVTVQVSANGGSNFETVTLDSEHSFTNTGTELEFKITASDTVDITLVRIIYE